MNTTQPRFEKTYTIEGKEYDATLMTSDDYEYCSGASTSTESFSHVLCFDYGFHIECNEDITEWVLVYDRTVLDNTRYTLEECIVALDNYVKEAEGLTIQTR
jgi:hypothetical protein|tara:strand:- start:277 stop:582 length:306 start_codon:yes stop_codon:yes gene_type:complete